MAGRRGLSVRLVVLSAAELVKLALWVGSVIALYAINRNFWALAALPLIFAARHIDVTVPRARYLFYAYYPSHLAIVWLLER